MLNYYNKNAKEFFEGTAHVDMSPNYTEFLSAIPERGLILDAGCGSGRDTLAFKDRGYLVMAMDSSEEMCQLAGEYIGQSVFLCRFEEMDFRVRFNGIWASASLLHVSSQDLGDVLQRLYNHLRPEGVLYASFKYGDFEGERNGRYFHDLTEEKAKVIFESVGFRVEKIWITSDVRRDRESEKWLNILVRREK